MAENNDSNERPLQFESLGVHTGLNRSGNEAKDVPVYASTSFVFNDSAHGAAIFSMNAEAFCYSRIANPTVDVFEKRMAALEGGAAALATASGESALFVTIMALAQSGSNIVVASRVSEASNHQFKHRLPPLGITARFVERGSVDEVQKSIDENTKVMFAESVFLKDLSVSDINALASLAHQNGVPLVIDNTHGAGGFFIQPIKHGADVVIESARPWLSISASNQGGIIVDGGNFPWDKNRERFPQFFEPSPGFHGLRMWEKFGKLAFIFFARVAVLRDIGPCLNPFEAAMLLAGLETLAVRMERVADNAGKLARWLKDNDKVEKILYPGFGGVALLNLANTTALPQLLNKFKLVSIGQNIGGSKTMVIPVNNMSMEEKKHDSENQDTFLEICVSVGLENIDDLKADFEQALSQIQ